MVPCLECGRASVSDVCQDCARSSRSVVGSSSLSVVTLIAGPPCAGKNTYLAEHRQSGDLVLDVDALHVALTGLPSHVHRKEVLPFVYEARDAVLAKWRVDGGPNAWVINVAPRLSERNRWRSLYGADVVLLVPDPDECHRRADADGRPRVWHSYIDSWFNKYEPDGTVV